MMHHEDCHSDSTNQTFSVVTRGYSVVSIVMSSTSDVRIVTRPGWARAVAQSMASMAYLWPCRPASARSAAAWRATAGKLGTILVDANGRTLYLFEADKSTQSTCNGACAAAWPPLLTSGGPTAGGSAKPGLLGTTKRSDGKTQVTYNGHPLYGYAGDSKPGDTNGEGLNQFGAAWYVLNTSGEKVDLS